ncbi:hypothetical protein LEN26_001735 [Aphanomyces euteiches]|nr:hypothetical protein LEN26_001735 [Aphanomyces euteiches]
MLIDFSEQGNIRSLLFKVNFSVNMTHDSVIRSVIVVKIAFFIPEWATLVAYLDALRPTVELGPLEHLWQLHLLQWKADDLWPNLNLTKLNDASRFHVENIAKYYSKVSVDQTTDLEWFLHHINPNASVYWKRTFKFMIVDPETLRKWRQVRLTDIDLDTFYPDKSIIAALSYLDHLVVLRWNLCTEAVATAILEFAASSTTVRELVIASSEDDYEYRCMMTTPMVADLVKWITSQPIRGLSLDAFTWYSLSLKRDVLTAAFECLTLDYFCFDEIDQRYLAYEAVYNRRKSQLSFDFGDTNLYHSEPFHAEPLSEFICHFKETPWHIKSIFVTVTFSNCFVMAWKILLPILLRSNVEVLVIQLDNFTQDETALIIETIGQLSTVREIVFTEGILRCQQLMAVLHAAPASLRKCMVRPAKRNLPNLEPEEVRAAAQAFALEQFIDLKYEFV